MILIGIPFLISVTLSSFAVGEEALPKKFALLIGINEYSGKNFTRLDGCKNDMELMYGLLTGRFEFKSQDVKMLLDKDATHSKIEGAIKDLAAKVQKGDIVYIHYSGHGSRTCDLNGDESEETGLDSTWVSYGSRGEVPSESTARSCASIVASHKQSLSQSRIEASVNIDDYDVLDDEINQWLMQLGEKTDGVILVSDSCHSGTVTRGAEALATRGAPHDLRAHPLGAMTIAKGTPNWLSISASRDDERAREYNPNEKKYGMFTWFWAQSLTEVGPHDTWNNVFKNTSAKIAAVGYEIQHPQIEGTKDRHVFGGYIQNPPKTFTVTRITKGKVWINAGSLLGVTKGSVFRKHEPSIPAEKLPKIEIKDTESLASSGETKNGEFKIGDLVVLESWMPDSQPMKVMIKADLESDQALVDALKKMTSTLPAFEITGASDFQNSQLILRIIHPKKEASGKYIYAKEGDSLPQTFPDAKPECWVLTPAEQLYDGQESLIATMSDKGIQNLRDNLEKLARARNFISLSSSPGQESPLDFRINVYRETKAGELKTCGKDKNSIAIKNKCWIHEKMVSGSDLNQLDNAFNGPRLLTFTVENKSNKEYFLYLVNMTPRGQVLPFFPKADMSIEYGKIKAWETRNITEVTLLIEEDREYVRLIAALKPLDIHLIHQEAYRTRSASAQGSRGELNALEVLLVQKAGIKTRGADAGPIASSDWTTSQAIFNVKK